MKETYGVNELRQMFLRYFERQEHLAMKSFSLVPDGDKSLLIINSGMAPLKPYFTGQEIPPKKRVTTCQKCIRTGDIDNVGKTARHLTFFEMLGNFSFGDYFKKEALTWSWEFLTKEVGLDPERLYPSVFMDDDEAFRIWTEIIGVSPERITKFGRGADGSSDNFWEHGAGPCGPCSEIYYDRGERYESGVIEEYENAEGFLVGKDAERYIEVWNDVFTQFDGDGQGNYTELLQKNIDTGMGLERLAVVVQDAESVFDIDTMKAIRDRVCGIAHVSYAGSARPGSAEYETAVSVRVIVDHMRSATFLISDGVMPSNEGRGYVLRRLIRRAARHGRKLGIEQAFLTKISETVIEGAKDGYPELSEKRDFILRVLAEEETRFAETLDQGLKILGEMTRKLREENGKELPGEEAFRLYDTFGFPFDMTRDILAEQGLSVDETGFERAMRQQKETARGARAETNYMGAEASVYDELDPALTTAFVGYESLSAAGKIVAMTRNERRKEPLPPGALRNDVEGGIPCALTEKLLPGECGTILTDVTPFYGTMGGQIGDTGRMETPAGTFIVYNTIRLKGGQIAHVGELLRPEAGKGKEAEALLVGDTVTMSVCPERTVLEYGRRPICRAHSATHLLHKALREVLGTHVEQAGSLVTGDYLRFDFSHFEPMTAQDIAAVEDYVRSCLRRALPVVTEEMPIAEARKLGAMALFGEKYGETVRVVRMGEDVSIELCGGTHVSNTQDIGIFKIMSESGIAAGVRRITALTGERLFEYLSEAEEHARETARELKTPYENLWKRIADLREENRTLRAQIQEMKAKQARDAAGDVSGEDVRGVTLITKAFDDADMNALRETGDSLKSREKSSVVVLTGVLDGKVSLLVMATEEAVKRGAHAGNLVKALAPLVGGGGGGRPNMAQAGGKNAAGVQEALRQAKKVLSEQLA